MQRVQKSMHHSCRGARATLSGNTRSKLIAHTKLLYVWDLAPCHIPWEKLSHVHDASPTPTTELDEDEFLACA